MSEGNLTLLRRVSIGSESSTIYSTPGAYTHVRGLENLSYSFPREALADNRHLTSRRGQNASHLGAKAPEMGFRVPIHNAIFTDLDTVFTSAFGTKSANTFVWSAGAAGTVTKSSGSFDPIVLVTISAVTHARPVKSVASNVATLAIQGGGANTTAKNAATDSGALYYQDPTAAYTSMALEMDASGESDHIKYTMAGAVPDQVTLSLDLEQRLGLDLHFMGGDFTINTAANITNPSALSGQQLGFQAECFIQDIGTPAAGTQIDLHSLEANLCWRWIARKATRAVAATLVGSAIVGWKQELWCPDGVKVTVTKQSTTWTTARTNKTAYGLFVSWSLGGPGDTAAANKVALWIPRVVLDADPVEVDIDGIAGYELQFKVEEESALSSDDGSDIVTQGALAFFKAA